MIVGQDGQTSIEHFASFIGISGEPPQKGGFSVATLCGFFVKMDKW